MGWDGGLMPTRTNSLIRLENQQFTDWPAAMPCIDQPTGLHPNLFFSSYFLDRSLWLPASCSHQMALRQPPVGPYSVGNQVETALTT